MTAGLAFEGLNHAGVENSNIIVILNDTAWALTQMLVL
jgi:1-deoxy-D-xylulose-5-phosphate synthase